MIEDRPGLERGGDDSLAERGNRLGGDADTRDRIDAATSPQNPGVSSTSLRSSPCQASIVSIYGVPGAPTNPEGGPIPSISSHRGHDCDGVPFCARSITSADIFSTTWLK